MVPQDFFAMMMGGMPQQQQPSELVADLSGIAECLMRPPLDDLRTGDVLKQRKFGDEYVFTFNDQPVVFVRYLRPTDWRFGGGGILRILPVDIVVAAGVEKRTGHMVCFAVDSTGFEKTGENALALMED